MPIDRNIKLGMRLINSIHFIGIGGSGMCGIAEFYLIKGIVFLVQMSVSRQILKD